MCEVCQIAVDNGATTLNIPDTVGFAVPEDYGKLIRYVIDHVRGDFVVSTHCHDDLGLAVANSLAGVASGARQVECAINGLGERAGNAALEEVVMAIKTRSDYFEGCTVNVRTEELARTSRLVSRLTGYHVQFNKAVVGRNAFAHEAGIHQHGVLADRETYEIIDASTRRPGSRADRAGQALGPPRVRRHAGEDGSARPGRRAQRRVRALQGAGRPEGRDHRSRPRGDRRRGARHRRSCTGSRSTSSNCTAAPRRKPTAHVVLGDADGKVEANGTGDGMIDAAIAAISEATGVAGSVGNFQVSSVTGGSDTLGAVAITVEADGRKVTGRGVATDVVEASARAYLNAVNKIVRLHERGEVRTTDRDRAVILGRTRSAPGDPSCRHRQTSTSRRDPEWALGTCASGTRSRIASRASR